MNFLNIALLQLTPGRTLEESLEKGLGAARRAKELGADIALFPEMWSNGYRIYDRPAEEWTAEAIDRDGRFLRAFGALAKELGIAIAITYLERWPAGPRNSMALFDRHGARMLDFSKVHTCDFSAERALTPGDGFSVIRLETEKGPVQVGAMICYDREFPESGRILMLQGAELILVPNACPMEINRLSQLRARAYENMVAVATCNYPETVPDCNGHSTLFDGVAYLPHLPGSRDCCLLEADGSEGVFLARLDLDLLRDYRAREVHGNAFRRPELYGRLVKKEIQPPFLRKERRP